MRGGKRFSVPSKAYEGFANEAAIHLKSQINKMPFEFPITGDVVVLTQLFIKGRTKVDGDNLHTSLLDVLQKAGVIADDEQVVKGVYIKYREQKEWSATIEILEVGPND